MSLPPDQSRPSAGVDPSAIQDAAGFASALTELRARAALTIREVSRRTGIPSATLGGYFSGRHLPPPTQPAQLSELLSTLGVPADQHDEWRTALNRVRRVPGPRTAGKVTPYRGLESYGVRDAAWFVGRERFVDQLQSQVAALFDEDGPRLVTLVGASGTGKSSLLRAGLMARLAMEGITPVLLAPGGDPQRSLAVALARFRPDTRKRLVVVDQLEEVFAERMADEVRQEFLTTLIDLADEPGTVVVTALRADFYGHAVEEPTLLPMLRSNQVLVGPMDEESLRRVVVEPARRAGATVEPELVELVMRDLSPRGDPPEASALPMMSHALLATWKHARNARLSVSDYVAVGGVAGAVQRTAEHVYGSLDEEGRRTARWLFAQLVNVDEEGAVTRRRLDNADLDGGDALPHVVEAFVAGRILTATDHTLEISHEVLLTAWPRLGEWLAADRDVLRLRRRVSLAAQAWDENGRESEGLLRGGLLDLARPLAEDRSPLSALERTFVAESIEHAAEDERNQRRRLTSLRSLLGMVAVLALVAILLSIYLVRAIGQADEERLAAEDERNRALSRQVAVEASKIQDAAPALGMQLALAAYELAPTVEARSGLLGVTGDTIVSRLTGPEGTMRAVISPDGGLVVTANSDGVVRLWSDPGDAAPELLSEIETEEPGELYAAVFSPDGRFLATAGATGVVTIVDLRDPASPVTWAEPLTGPESAVQDLAFAPDGRTLYAATSDPALFGWRLQQDERAEPLRTVDPFGGPVQGVAVSSTGLVATGSADGFVRVWRIRGDATLVPLYKLSVGAPTNFVHSVAFSPDGGLLAAGSKDKQVRVWDAEDGRLVNDELGGFTSWVNSVAFSRDGRSLAAGASGGMVRVWQTGSWELEHDLAGPTNFTSVQFSPSGNRLVTGSIDGTARIYRLTGPQLPPFGDNIWGIAAPDTGDLIYVGVGSSDPQIARVDVSEPLTPVVRRPLLGPESAGALDGVVGVSPDGSTVAAGTATGEVVVWDVDESGRPALVGVLGTASQLIENISFARDGGSFAASSDDGTTTVYSLEEGGRPVKLAELSIDSLAMGVAVSPDSTLVAVGGADNLVHLWRLDGPAPEKAATLEGFDNYVPAAAFSPDGRTLAAGSADGTVRLWDVISPSAPIPLGEPLVGPTDTVFGVAFDQSGERLAAASADGILWLWALDRDGGTLSARLTSGGDGLYQALFRPAGRVFAGGENGQVTSWLTDVEAAEALVCQVAGSPITEEEWAQHVPGADYDPPCD